MNYESCGVQVKHYKPSFDLIGVWFLNWKRWEPYDLTNV